MKSLKLLSPVGLFSCLALAAPFVQADDGWRPTSWADPAWYVGVGAGTARATIDQQRLAASLISNGAASVMFSTYERDTAYKLLLGKQLNRNFALEASYFDLGHFGFTATTTPAGILGGDARFRGVGLDLLGTLPLSAQISLYGRVGANYGYTQDSFSGDRLYAVSNPNPSEHGFNGKVGLGIGFKLTEALALRGEYERYRLHDGVGNRGNVDFISLNLVYQIGQPAPRRVAYSKPPVQEAPRPIPAAPPVASSPVVPAAAPPSAAPTAMRAPISEKVSFASEALFDFDKSAIKPEGQQGLDDLLSKIAQLDLEVIVAVGNTDSVGTPAYNMALSQRRAEAIKSYLVAKGLDKDRIYVEGKGESAPVADNATAAGRRLNRRVTVEVVGRRTVAP